MMRYNKIKQQEHQEEQRLQNEFDQALVSESLQRAREDELIEKEAKEKEREASRTYRQIKPEQSGRKNLTLDIIPLWFSPFSTPQNLRKLLFSITDNICYKQWRPRKRKKVREIA